MPGWRLWTAAGMVGAGTSRLAVTRRDACVQTVHKVAFLSVWRRSIMATPQFGMLAEPNDEAASAWLSIEGCERRRQFGSAKQLARWLGWWGGTKFRRFR
jgi:hypothetical protein